MRFFNPLRSMQWMRKRLLWIVLLFICLLTLTYLIYQRISEDKPPVAGPILVATTPAQYQNIPITVNAIGTLLAPEGTMLKAQEAGVVTKILFKNGQQVHAGQLLVQLNNLKSQALYQKAYAAMIEAQDTYNRYVALNKSAPEVLSKIQMDQVYSNYQQAQANLKAAAQEVQAMQITAPFSGTMGATTLTIGSYVQQGAEVVAIINRETLEASYTLPESYYGQVQVGQRVHFTSDAYPGIIFKASVDYVAPLVSQQNRSFSVRALVSDQQAQLSPGMLINVTQILNPAHRALVIPAVSLITDMSGYGVYIIQDGKVLELPVEVGMRFGSLIEITSGLTEGTAVISAGQEKVQPGSSVTTVNTSQD
jgi:RND family efflux transporter MFP subunit